MCIQHKKVKKCKTRVKKEREKQATNRHTEIENSLSGYILFDSVCFACPFPLRDQNNVARIIQGHAKFSA